MWIITRVIDGNSSAGRVELKVLKTV